MQWPLGSKLTSCNTFAPANCKLVEKTHVKNSELRFCTVGFFCAVLHYFVERVVHSPAAALCRALHSFPLALFLSSLLMIVSDPTFTHLFRVCACACYKQKLEFNFVGFSVNIAAGGDRIGCTTGGITQIFEFCATRRSTRRPRAV